MKKLYLLIGLLTLCTSMYAQPVVFFNFLSHNEETAQWNSFNYYNTNRAKIISLANYFQANGITWNMQSDWRYLTNVLTVETPALMATTNNKNILMYLYQDKGIEMDPHAHESTYIYPDVVKLMDSIGLPESKIIGGSIYNDFNGMNVWTNLIYGQYGVIFPSKFWQPDYMMGGGTPNHVADLKYYGFWNPTDTDAYLVHNPASPLHHIGVGCEIKIRDTSTIANLVAEVRDVLTNVQSGNYPSNGIYLQTIFFEQGDLNNTLFYNKVVQLADSVNAMVQTGQAQWKTLKQVCTYWTTTYGSQMFQWECGQMTTDIQQENNLSGLTISPNPTTGNVTITNPDVMSTLIITNAFGQVVYSSKPDEKNISLRLDAAPGIYFVKAEAGDGVRVKKVVVR